MKAYNRLTVTGIIFCSIALVSFVALFALESAVLEVPVLLTIIKTLMLVFVSFLLGYQVSSLRKKP